MSFSLSLTRQPAKLKTARKMPAFLPLSAAAVTFSVNGSNPPLTFPCTLTGLPASTARSAQQIVTCTGSFQAPAGQTDSFAVTAVDGSQTALATGTTSEFINPNGSNALTVTLDGIVSQVIIEPAAPGLSSASSTSTAVAIVALDADEDLITGTYANPVTVGTTDATGTISVATPVLTTDTSQATLGYTQNAGTEFSDNHFSITATATGATTGTQPFVVGRTLYTWGPNAVYGIAPGASTITRTVTMPALSDVRSMACDGTNLYLADYGTQVQYAISPSATTGPSITYTNDENIGMGVAAASTGGRPTLYVGNWGSGVAEFQAGTGTAPPANGAPAFSSNAESQEAVTLDGSGDVFAAVGGSDPPSAGFFEYPPTITNAPIRSGSNAGAGTSNMIAIDTGTTPATVYTSDSNEGLGSIAEYDSAATTPTQTSTDNAGLAVFADAAGRVYANAAGTFDVYGRRAINGPVLYSLPATSLAFDTASYAYALTSTGIAEYAPGAATLLNFIAGNSFGQPSSGPNAFGVFCQ